MQGDGHDELFEFVSWNLGSGGWWRGRGGSGRSDGSRGRSWRRCGRGRRGWGNEDFRLLRSADSESDEEQKEDVNSHTNSGRSRKLAAPEDGRTPPRRARSAERSGSFLVSQRSQSTGTTGTTSSPAVNLVEAGLWRRRGWPRWCLTRQP